MSGIFGDSPLLGGPPERDDMYVMKRRAYLVDRANQVALRHSESLCPQLRELWGNPNIEYLAFGNAKSKNFSNILQEYFNEIDNFKSRHRMPLSDLANECKRAAAWIFVGSDADLWNGIFDFKCSNIPENKIERFQIVCADLNKTMTTELIITLCYNELDVDENKVDPTTVKLLRHNIAKYKLFPRNASNEDNQVLKSVFDWLVATMHLLAQAYRRDNGGQSNC